MRWHDYDYALLRVVPRVHTEQFVNVGVLLHARTARFLGLRLHAGLPLDLPHTLSPDLLHIHLAAYTQIADGSEDAGPIGLLPPSERFHWLTAPRSAVIQTSALRAGRTTNPAATLDRLFAHCIASLP
ncbi:MAG: DUF3037 domain-containing protein [Rhodothermales bacterium]